MSHFNAQNRPLGQRSDLLPVDMSIFNTSFISSPLFNEKRLDFLYYRHTEEETLHADIFFGERAMGPPDLVHGGCMTAVLDEAMGVLPLLMGYPVVSVNVNVDLVKMTPINSWGVVEVGIERIDERKILTRSSVSNLEGEVLVRGEGVYVIVPKERYVVSEKLSFE